MRVLVLLAYIAVAAWMFWTYQDSPAAIIHLTGAIAAVCATSLAITYASLIGDATPEPGGAPDQAEAYIAREDWDD